MKTSLKSIRSVALCASIGLVASLTWAQAAGGGDSVSARSGAASASAPGLAASPGARRGPRWDANNTPGWSMMTPAERSAHRQRMSDMKTRDECAAYQEKHHEDMLQRAKERGLTAPDRPRRDGCAGLTP